MAIFFFLLLTFFSFQNADGSVFFKEGIHLTRGLKRVSQSFKQLTDFPISHKYEESSPSFALLALGVCGASLMINDDAKCEGRDIEFESMLVGGYKKIQEMEKKTKGKELVFLMGPSKGGKSFIAKNITGKTREEIKAEEKGTNQRVSQTLYPEVFCKGDFCFCDPPAFKDIGRDKNHALLASVMLRCALKSGTDRKARLMLLTHPNLLGISRADTIFKKVFDEEFFPLLDVSVFSKGGILFVFNDNEGEKKVRDYSTKLKDTEKAAEDLHKQSTENPLARFSKTESVMKQTQISEFYLKGVKGISDRFVDYNLATHEEVFNRLRTLQPFSLSLKNFGEDTGKLFDIWSEGNDLMKSIERKKKEAELINLENKALDSILKGYDSTSTVKKISEEGNDLEVRLRSLLEEREKFYKDKGTIRTLNEGRKKATSHKFGYLWWNYFTDVTIENPSLKPFRLPVIVWINGKGYQLSPDTQKVPDGLQERRIIPDTGVLKLVYRVPFTGNDVDVWAQIETTDSEPGIAIVRSKNLESIADDIKSTEEMIRKNKDLLALIKGKKSNELESRRIRNAEIVSLLTTEISNLEHKFSERKDVFEATAGLVDRLYDLNGLRKDV
jgi:hypothetical protein